MAAALWAALPAQAHGAGFVLTGRGVRAFSRGAAAVAAADDLNAQWSNPARLALQSAPLAAYLDLSMVDRAVGFQRSESALVKRYDPDAEGSFPEVHGGGAPQVVPALAVGSNFGLRRFMFTLGAYAPQGSQAEWPEDGPQRYSLTRNTSVMLIYQLSAAWRPLDNLAVGAGFQLQDFLLRQELDVSAYPGLFGWQEDPSLDGRIRTDVVQRLTPSFVLGVWWRAVAGLELAASFQAGFEVEAEGDLLFRRPSHYYFKDMKVEGSDIVLETSFPYTARAAARYVFTGGHDVEAAWVFTRWSVHDDVVVSPTPAGNVRFTNLPGLGSYVVRPFTVREDFDDTHSLHLGGAVKLYGGRLELRAGGYVESSAVPTETLNVSVVDAGKVLVAAGASYDFGEFRLNAGLGRLFFASRTVSDSTKTQVNPLFSEDIGPYGEGGPSTVGNGRYTSAATLLGLSLDYRMGGGF